jgi:RNA polymerase sigma factor (sigma-70 family)
MAEISTTVVEQFLRAATGGGAALNDRDLLRSFAETGDQAAFGALFRRHAGMVLGVCRRVLSSEQDAEDACQATFLLLARKAKSGRWQPSIANWLYLTARRVAHNARVSAARRARREKSVAVPDSVQPVDRMTGRELLAALDEELDRLPPRYREPLVLCYLEGLTRDEAATRLGVLPGTLKSLLERGRKRLGAALTRRGCVLGAGLLALAATSPAGASPPRLVRSVLAAVAGKPSAAVAELAGEVAVKGIAKKSLAALLFLTATAALGFGLVGAQPPASPQPPPSDKQPAGRTVRSISGRVVGPDGKPVAGAKLFTSAVTATPFMMVPVVEIRPVGTADAAGRFTVAAVPTPGNLFAVAPGFGLDWLQVPRPNDPQLTGEQTLRLPADVPIRGRLVTTEGLPAAGVTVTVAGVTAFEHLDDFLRVYELLPRNFEQGTGARPLSARLNGVLGVKPTDADGRFEVHGVGAERLANLEVKGPAVATSLLLVVTRPNFDAKAYSQEVLRSRDERTPLYGLAFEHVVDRAVEAEGTVREADNGKPVSGAVVRERGESTVTDAQGRYRLSGMWKKSRQYLLEVSAPETLPLVNRLVRIPPAAVGKPLHADVELPRGIVITGRVYDKVTGKGIPECMIHFTPLPENRLARAGKTVGLDFGGQTGADGRYRLVVIPGQGALLAQVPSSLLEIDGVPICPYKSVEFDAADRRRITISDQLKPWRALVTAGPLEVLDHNNAGKVLDLKDDAPAGSCDLAVDPGKTLTVDLRDPEGKPLAGVAVSGVGPLPSPYAIRPVPFKAATGRIFALDPDKPRTVVFLHADRKLAALATLRGDEKEPVVVQLAATAVLTGRVLNDDGQPLAGADVYTHYSTPLSQPLINLLDRNRLPQTDREGRFRLEDIVPGVPLKVGFRKGQRVVNPKEGPAVKPLEAGQTFDVGDIHVKPR